MDKLNSEELAKLATTPHRKYKLINLSNHRNADFEVIAATTPYQAAIKYLNLLGYTLSLAEPTQREIAEIFNSISEEKLLEISNSEAPYDNLMNTIKDIWEERTYQKRLERIKK